MAISLGIEYQKHLGLAHLQESPLITRKKYLDIISKTKFFINYKNREMKKILFIKVDFRLNY
jgi:hypothetical protein